MIIIDTVVDLVKEGFGYYKDTKKAKHDLTMAGIQNRQRLLLDEASNNHEWEMKALETSSKGLKRMSFMLFAGPIIITVVNPEYGAHIWQSLELVPQGFLKIYYAITGAIWGISALKDHGVSFKQTMGNVGPKHG